MMQIQTFVDALISLKGNRVAFEMKGAPGSERLAIIDQVGGTCLTLRGDDGKPHYYATSSIASVRLADSDSE